MLCFEVRTDMVTLSIFTLVIILAASQAGAREDVNFDFAWRFALGDFGTAVHCSADAFPQNMSMVECLGLRSDPATNADDCLNACCGDEMCAIWQYAKDKGCWIGQSSDCKHPNNDWVGGGRDTPAPAPPPAKSGPLSPDYDDSSWELVNTPHDGIIIGTYTESGPKSHGYLPTNITWYRKHFNLPSDWKGQSIWVYFEGVFRASTTYLNGQQLLYHDSGYTSFSVRLDNASTVHYGDGKDNENVLVVRADATRGTGWWYEGGGIYRHNHLVSSSRVHMVVDGVYGPSEITGKISPHDQNDMSKGLMADAVTMYPSAEVINDDTSGNSPSVMVRFTLYDEDAKSVASGDTSSMTIATGKTAMFNTTVKLTNVEVWSNTRTYLYTLQAEVISGSTTVDAVNVSVGIRSSRWDADNGFYLNDVHFTWRGFNNHNDFTGVGAAVPDRVNLFRGQMIRAVGANSWRMSHNPPIPVMLDIMDRLGIVVWDENRNFGNNTNWVECQRDMVKRDRNHPSVVIWSFCNEGGCYPKGNGPIGKMFRDASYSMDTYRPVSANMFNYANLSDQIDVQGFSHRGGSNFDSYHQSYPKKPLIGSECCSCQTQRGEDDGGNVHKSFAADCSQSQTRAELDRQFVAGCMVWTLFDYYGEPTSGWPHVSCSFGQIDLAGFAKPQAYWYRAWWLYSAKVNKTTGGDDVPINVPPLLNPDTNSDENNYLVHIVEHWEPQDSSGGRTIHVLTNALKAELFVNGKTQGVKQLNWEGFGQWDGITFAAGNITAKAMSDSGDVVATHSRITSGAAAKVVASVDAPSEMTGTGSALVLDGQDAGMVGVKIIDAQGNVVHSSSHNVTFRIVSGPGRIIGVGNGDPTCHEPNQASWRSAYHGLARAIIQVTEDHASSPMHRHRLLQIDSEGGYRTRIRAPGVFSAAPDGIVVEASVEGLGTSTVTIPVSTDAVKDGVLAAAKQWMK